MGGDFAKNTWSIRSNKIIIMPAKKVTKKVAAKKAPKKVVKKVAKKVAKKAAPKKATKKAAPKKKVACNVCSATCEASEAFWVHNGPILHTLDDLLRAFKVMSDEQYKHHTTRGDGNDFANWVQFSLKDAGCAANLRKAKTKGGAVKVLTSKCNCASK